MASFPYVIFPAADLPGHGVIAIDGREVMMVDYVPQGGNQSFAIAAAKYQQDGKTSGTITLGDDTASFDARIAEFELLVTAPLVARIAELELLVASLLPKPAPVVEPAVKKPDAKPPSKAKQGRYR